MTDNDIIKALECCSIINDCKGCYFNTHEAEDICAREIVKNAFDLINRQQAEIERLNSLLDGHLWDFCSISGCEGASNDCWKTCPDSRCNKIKSGAIKEFAEKLKEDIIKPIDNYWNSNAIDYYLTEGILDKIDTLVEEMVGNIECQN